MALVKRQACRGESLSIIARDRLYGLGGFHHAGFYCGFLRYDLKVRDFNPYTDQIQFNEEVII